MDINTTIDELLKGTPLDQIKTHFANWIQKHINDIVKSNGYDLTSKDDLVELASWFDEYPAEPKSEPEMMSFEEFKRDWVEGEEDLRNMDRDIPHPGGI